jgi:hypothetical protein
VQRHGQVQGGLAAQGGEQGVRPLSGDDLLEDLRDQGLDVGGIGHLGIGHDGGRVGVDQDHPIAFPPQDLEGLGPRIVELGRLADHNRPGADDQDGADVGAPRHPDFHLAAQMGGRFPTPAPFHSVFALTLYISQPGCSKRLSASAG